MSQDQHPPYVESFYHLAHEGIESKACQGVACFAARHQNPATWEAAISQNPRVYCLGKCYAAPATGATKEFPRIETHSRETIVLKRILERGAHTLDEYTRMGGYAALKKVLKNPPLSVLDEIELSGIRGRGGAAFPAGRKWRLVARQKSSIKYVIANADEGDPGTFGDRFIMEEDPHSLIEGLILAAYGVGAGTGYIYLRKEYPLAKLALEKAFEEARAAGLLGQNILGSGFSFDIELFVGNGSYVCGERSALINSLEGKRPEVRTRPPQPSIAGLYNKPTLVNNVETFANIAWIINNGGQAYKDLGFENSKGTKLISLSSLFNRPGLYEVEFGVTLRHIVENIGGGLKEGSLKALMVGGPLAGVIPPALLDTRFGFEEMKNIGASVGHGGFVAFNERTAIPALIKHVFSFGSYESCGKCAPCRLGSHRVEEIFAGIDENGFASRKENGEIIDIVYLLKEVANCGLGTGLADFAASIMCYYEKELEQCFK